MLTVKALLKDGKVEFLEKIPLEGEYKILITFLEGDLENLIFPDHDPREVTKIVGNYMAKLSNREMEVLQLTRQGLKTEEIAERLEISHGTARNYLSSIYEKLKVNNKTGAVTRAIELGLLE